MESTKQSQNQGHSNSFGKESEPLTESSPSLSNWIDSLSHTVTDSAKSTVASVQSTTSSLLHSIGDTTGHMAHEVTDTTGKTISEFTHSTGQLIHDVNETTHRLLSDMTHKVNDSVQFVTTKAGEVFEGSFKTLQHEMESMKETFQSALHDEEVTLKKRGEDSDENLPIKHPSTPETNTKVTPSKRPLNNALEVKEQKNIEENLPSNIPTQRRDEMEGENRLKSAVQMVSQVIEGVLHKGWVTREGTTKSLPESGSTAGKDNVSSGQIIKEKSEQNDVLRPWTRSNVPHKEKVDNNFIEAIKQGEAPSFAEITKLSLRPDPKPSTCPSGKELFRAIEE